MNQLLQSSVRLLDCPWLQQQHRGQVEACIKTLALTGNDPGSTSDSKAFLSRSLVKFEHKLFSLAAKNRSICLPLDLEAQINSMLSSSALNSLSRTNPNYKSSSRSIRPSAPTNPWDYKNIIEKLQVHQNLNFMLQ